MMQNKEIDFLIFFFLWISIVKNNEDKNKKITSFDNIFLSYEKFSNNEVKPKIRRRL